MDKATEEIFDRLRENNEKLVELAQGEKVVYVIEKEKKEVAITKEEFQAYEDIRSSGATNMFNTRIVSSLSGLRKEKIMLIMNEYNWLMKKYSDVRGK